MKEMVRRLKGGTFVRLSRTFSFMNGCLAQTRSPAGRIAAMQGRFIWHQAHGIPRPYGWESLPPVQLEITRGRAKFKLRRVVGRVYLIGTANDSDMVLGDP